MKKNVIVILVLLVMFAALGVPGNANADGQVVRLGYTIQGGGWFTGIVITNTAIGDIENLKVTFCHKDGSWTMADRKELGRLSLNEMKVYSLGDLYEGTLPDGTYSLAIFHVEADLTFTVNLFIMNNLDGIGGYGFQQFSSEPR